MPYPEPSMSDHGAPWNEDYDEETGTVFCTCSFCKTAKRKAAEDERRMEE